MTPITVVTQQGEIAGQGNSFYCPWKKKKRRVLNQRVAPLPRVKYSLCLEFSLAFCILHYFSLHRVLYTTIHGPYYDKWYKTGKNPIRVSLLEVFLWPREANATQLSLRIAQTSNFSRVIVAGPRDITSKNSRSSHFKNIFGIPWILNIFHFLCKREFLDAVEAVLGSALDLMICDPFRAEASSILYILIYARLPFIYSETLLPGLPSFMLQTLHSN